jgi:hypothetical protein
MMSLLLQKFLVPAALCCMAACGHAAAFDDALLNGAAGNARTGDHAINTVSSDGTLGFTLTPGLWIPRAKGEATLAFSGAGAAATQFDLAQNFQLRSMERTFLPEIALRKGEMWEMHLSGFDFSTVSSGVMNLAGAFGELNFQPGDPFRASFDMMSVAGELRIGVYRPYGSASENNRNSDGRLRVDFRVAPILGIRYVEVDHHVEQLTMGGSIAGREQAGGAWVVPYAGLRLDVTYRPGGEFGFIRMIRIEAGAALGPALGGDGGFAWQAYLMLTVAPASSSLALSWSASSFETFSFTGLGAPSTMSLASFRPRPVASRTALMT